jgi:hypothetical protein
LINSPLAIIKVFEFDLFLLILYIYKKIISNLEANNGHWKDPDLDEKRWPSTTSQAAAETAPIPNRYRPHCRRRRPCVAAAFTGSGRKIWRGKGVNSEKKIRQRHALFA